MRDETRIDEQESKERHEAMDYAQPYKSLSQSSAVAAPKPLMGSPIEISVVTSAGALRRRQARTVGRNIRPERSSLNC